ncbi:MAG: adenylate/guanylate cyclase domain-containing protein [Cyclobacteriaceae bacterium]
MKFNTKRRWQIIFDYMIGWTLAFIFISIVRGVGTTEAGSVQFELSTSIAYSMVFGPIFGAISGLIQVKTEEHYYRRLSLQKMLIVRILYGICLLIFIVVVSYAVVPRSMGVEIGLLQFAFEDGSFPIYFYIFTVDVFMALLRQVNLMLGPQKLLKLIFGRYYTPREEERIFMFLDLQSSTLLAEKLGHEKYSSMIQECFNDLGVVVENEAEIYQYVGDEVVLTWKLRDGLRNLNCIQAFFNFKQQLKSKRQFYLDKFGCEPFFKAGLNEGLVMVTEIGRYKKEIAYHGDAINTAARIQGKCNELNQEFLISANLKDKLSPSAHNFDALPPIPLKGKQKEVSIYAVSLPNDSIAT